MALGARLELRQGQSLVITPQLQQAIKLLQLSNIELDAYVEGELERNPLLARDETTDSAPEERRAEPQEEARAEAPDADPRDMDVTSDDLYGDASPGERASQEQDDGGASP